MAEAKKPARRARWIIAHKRRFFLVAALLFVVALAAAAWGAVAGNSVGLLIFAIVLAPSLMLVLMPLVNGRVLNDYDSGHEGTARRRLLKLNLVSSLLLLAASVLAVLGAKPGNGLTPFWWVLLVGSATMVIIVTVALLISRAKPDKRSPQA